MGNPLRGAPARRPEDTQKINEKEIKEEITTLKLMKLKILTTTTGKAMAELRRVTASDT